MIKATSAKVLTSRAPAKLILSGEYAVLYGGPALAMAIDRYATTTIEEQEQDLITFNFVQLNRVDSKTLTALQAFRLEAEAKYQRFVAGDSSIEQVLGNPSWLLQYAFSYFVSVLDLTINHGLVITIDADIPLGCGMGSSAATIISLLHALVSKFAAQVTIHNYCQLARVVENLQHGYSSGLDLFLATHGGCFWFAKQQAEARALPKLPLFLVNSGKPVSFTGECVNAVAKKFASSNIWDEFASQTQNLDQALKINAIELFRQSIRANHRLLQTIGVVPEKVSAFVTAIENYGGAAKISGAGSINGENAGIIIVSVDANIDDLLAQYGYQIMQIHGEEHGVTII